MSREFRNSGIPVTEDGNPKRVRAVYNFKGGNNDELCFKKGDVIVVSQMPSGGWWEGTLDGNTGWFPSNYVEDCGIEVSAQEANESTSMENSFINIDESSQQYRNMVLNELLEYETHYIAELREIIHKYLLPLQRSKIVPEKDSTSVLLCFNQLLEIHNQLVSHLNELKKVGPKEQRVGGVFMNVAAQLKEIHMEYCSLHPKFVHAIEKKKDDVCFLFNDLSKTTNAITALTSALSYSFRHLDKYPATLQQLQRYTDEAHPDRGDVQRASFVYREIVNACLLRRRQKEMELEVMQGNVKNWPEDAVPIESMGSAVNMGPVKVMTSGDGDDVALKDRYLLLFPLHLLILSVSNEMTSFVFDRLLPLQDLTLPRLPDPQSTKETFEILVTQDDRSTGPNKYTFQCQKLDEVRNWIKLMNHCKNNSEFKNIQSFKDARNRQQSATKSTISIASGTKSSCETPKRSKYWAKRSLLPHPPVHCSRSSSLDSDLNDHRAVSSNVSPGSKQTEDMAILQVIEAYYLSGKVKKQPNNHQSDLFDSSHMLLADEDRSISDHRKPSRNEAVCEDRSLAEVVYVLQDEVRQMRAEMEYLADCLKAERKARRKLKSMVEKLSLNR